MLLSLGSTSPWITGCSCLPDGGRRIALEPSCQGLTMTAQQRDIRSLVATTAWCCDAQSRGSRTPGRCPVPPRAWSLLTSIRVCCPCGQGGPVCRAAGSHGPSGDVPGCGVAGRRSRARQRGAGVRGATAWIFCVNPPRNTRKRKAMRWPWTSLPCSSCSRYLRPRAWLAGRLAHEGRSKVVVCRGAWPEPPLSPIAG
jgi:hypothetical protein